MPNQNPEIYIIIILGATLALLLVGFIVTILFLYQRRRHQQEQELVQLKDSYEQEALKSQLEIQETTFKTISQELHDNIGQLLSVVKMSLAVVPVSKEHIAYAPIQNSRQTLNKAILDLSNLTKGLHTDRISEIELAELIRFELELVKNSALMDVQYHVSGVKFQFDEQKKIFIFRMFQEIFNNMLKHSKATAVVVSIVNTTDTFFELEIKDNGIGFNVDEKKNTVSSTAGVGLKSLFNRAKLIGAHLRIISEPGKGTSVKIRLPATANT